MKEEIRKELFKLQDKKYQEFHKKLCPGTENIIGVRIPVLRNYAKQLLKEHDFYLLINKIGNMYYEEIVLQGMIIGQTKEKDFAKIKKLIQDFIPKIDNWAVCDVFCAGLKFTTKYEKEMWQLIQEYLKSNKEFHLRFAIVMILDFYIKEEYLDKDLEIFNNIKSDKYYVQMAVAWAISICLIKYYDKTIEFLKSGNCKLDNFTYNKSLQKARESYRISNEQKEELQSMKRYYNSN